MARNVGLTNSLSGHPLITAVLPNCLLRRLRRTIKTPSAEPLEVKYRVQPNHPKDYLFKAGLRLLYGPTYHS